MSESKFISVEDVARLYGTSAPTIRTWLKNGTIPGQKQSGRYWVVALQDLPPVVTTRRGTWTLDRGDAD